MNLVICDKLKILGLEYTRIGVKKSQSNKIDLRVFCEKLHFDSLFSSES